MKSEMQFHDEGPKKDRIFYTNKEKSPLIKLLSNFSFIKSTEGARFFLFFIILSMMILIVSNFLNMTPESVINSPLTPPNI